MVTYFPDLVKKYTAKMSWKYDFILKNSVDIIFLKGIIRQNIDEN